MSISVNAEHPAWKAIDDDDWNRSTFENFLNSVKGQPIVLIPPKGWPAGKVEEMVRAFEVNGCTVEVTQVHILMHGRSLCGMEGLPCDWPAYAKWVSFEDLAVMERTSCSECWEAFKARQLSPPGGSAGG